MADKGRQNRNQRVTMRFTDNELLVIRQIAREKGLDGNESAAIRAMMVHYLLFRENVLAGRWTLAEKTPEGGWKIIPPST